MKSIFKKSIIVAAFLFGAVGISNAQVKVGDNPTVINAGSVLELESTNKGLLMPRISLTNTTTWGLAGTPTAGMHVYNTNAGIASTNTAYPTAVNKIGEYYWDGTGWLALFVTAQRSTAITSARQTSSGAVLTIPGSVSNYCNGLNCSVDLNINSSFTVTNATNDVLLNIVGDYAVGGGSVGGVSFYYRLAVDINSPGVFEEVNKFYIQEAISSCSGGAVNFLTALKNLPPRTYNVRVYLSPWTNGNANPVNVAVGTAAVAGCGLANPEKQQVIVSVSQ